MEIGPYRVKDDKTLAYNEGAWNEFANVLFVDNPVGTGFSYVDTNAYVHELDDMAEQFVTFLEKWYALFPEYEHDDVSCPLFPAVVRLLTPSRRYTSPESRTPVSTSPTSPNTSWPATSVPTQSTSGT
jgi:hypothetical protein